MLTIDLKWYSGSAIVSRMSDYLVIVDTFRATSLVSTMLQLGAARIIPVSLVEEALALKEKNHEYIIVGEDRGKMPEGFAFGNSPSKLFSAAGETLRGRTIVHRSSAGTQAISRAAKVKKEQNAKYRVFTSSLLNSRAIASHIAGLNGGRDERLTVLCCGYMDKIYALEDELGAGALIGEIAPLVSDFKLSEVAASAYLSFRGIRAEDLMRMLRNTKSGARIVEVGDEPDIEFCSRMNIFDVVPELKDGLLADAASR